MEVQRAGPTPRVPESVGLVWRLLICIWNEFPGCSATETQV